VIGRRRRRRKKGKKRVCVEEYERTKEGNGAIELRQEWWTPRGFCLRSRTLLYLVSPSG